MLIISGPVLRATGARGGGEALFCAAACFPPPTFVLTLYFFQIPVLI